MARYRPNLEKAVNDILVSHGMDGKRLSFRQAERLTGLSPATISELAKGNARTAETLRRFAQGLDEDLERLLLLAGFIPQEALSLPTSIIPNAVSVSPVSTIANDIPPSDNSPGDYFAGLFRSGDIDADAAVLEMISSGLDREEISLFYRLGSALKRLPSGSNRALWKAHLRHTADLMERFITLDSSTNP